MTALCVLITYFVLRFVLKNYDLWYIQNTAKLGFLVLICAFIDLFIIIKLLIR